MCASVWRRAAIAVAAVDLWRRGPESAARGRGLRAAPLLSPPMFRAAARWSDRPKPAFLVRPRDIGGLADGHRRACRRSGPAQRDGPRRVAFLVEREFAEEIVARETLALYPWRPQRKEWRRIDSCVALPSPRSPGSFLLRPAPIAAHFASGAIAAHLAAGDRTAELLRTGALYGLVHGAALVAVGRDGASSCPTLHHPGYCRVGVSRPGHCCSALSLFTLALTGIAVLGWITAFGGVGLLIGWAALGLHALQRPSLGKPRCVACGYHRRRVCDTRYESRQEDHPMTTFLYTHPACLEHDPGRHHPEIAGALACRARGARRSGSSPGWSAARRRESGARRSVCACTRADTSSAFSARCPDPAMSGSTRTRSCRRPRERPHCAPPVRSSPRVDAVRVERSRQTRSAAVRPPGHHGRSRKKANGGFCLFNNAAIGALRGARGARARPGWRSSTSTSITATAHRRPLRPTAASSMPRPTNIRYIPRHWCGGAKPGWEI